VRWKSRFPGRNRAFRSRSHRCHELRTPSAIVGARRAPGRGSRRKERTHTPPPERRGPDASGLGAGFLIVGSILVFAGVGLVLGWPLGIALPLALAGAAVGIGIGFYVVWLRFFRVPR
jgi:hypothetical protein